MNQRKTRKHWENSCADCVYVGEYTGKINGISGPYDLYYCGDLESTVALLARYGPNAYEYLSGPMLTKHTIDKYFPNYRWEALVISDIITTRDAKVWELKNLDTGVTKLVTEYLPDWAERFVATSMQGGQLWYEAGERVNPCGS